MFAFKGPEFKLLSIKLFIAAFFIYTALYIFYDVIYCNLPSGCSQLNGLQRKTTRSSLKSYVMILLPFRQSVHQSVTFFLVHDNAKPLMPQGSKLDFCSCCPFSLLHDGIFKQKVQFFIFFYNNKFC